MKNIDINKIEKWGVAKKTKNVRAKPLLSIMVDNTITSKFLLDTLEGREPLGDGSVICIGDSNDIWQQMPKKLLQKYDVIEIDNEGWMVCKPKPDNSVECFEITASFFGEKYATPNISDESKFYIKGLWGEDFKVGDETHLIQKCNYGDFICRNREEHEDVWIVARKIFINTYNVIK